MELGPVVEGEVGSTDRESYSHPSASSLTSTEYDWSPASYILGAFNGVPSINIIAVNWTNTVQ